MSQTTMRLSARARAFATKHLGSGAAAAATPPASPKIQALSLDVAGLLTNPDYRGLPPELRASLREPAEQAIAAGNEQNAAAAIAAFPGNLATALTARTGWQSEGARIGPMRLKVLEMAGWKTPGAEDHRTKLARIEETGERGEYDTARQQLGHLEPEINEAHRKASIVNQWNVFKATPDFVRTLSQITTLSGWRDANTDSARLRSGMAAAQELATTQFDYQGATLRFAGIKTDTARTFLAWKTVREHNVAVPKLLAEFQHTDEIPAKGSPGSPGDAPWDEYLAAKAALQPVPVTTITGQAGLPGLRTTFRTKAEALCAAYQNGSAPPDVDSDYWDKQKDAYWDANRGSYDKALKTDPLSAANAKLKKAMIDARAGLSSAPSLKDRAAIVRDVVAKADAFLTAQATAPTPAAAKLYADYLKVQEHLEGAARVAADPTHPEIAAFATAYGSFKTDLDDPAKEASCIAALPGLVTDAEAVLQLKTVGLKAQVTAAKSASPSSAKASAALAAIDAGSTDIAILKRLSAAEQLDLMEALRADGMPGFDKNNAAASANNPKRKAMRKLYLAMSLDAGFMAEDDAGRQRLTQALAEDKAELKAAKTDWKVLDPAQRSAVLIRAAGVQAKAFGFEMPSQGIEIFHDPGPDADCGSYSPAALVGDPPVDKIKLNSADAEFEDFETAMDTIFHEMTHKYQNSLLRRLRRPSTDPRWLGPSEDPPYTQARMFELGNIPGGYVSPDEAEEADDGSYAKQPEEDHAWKAGPAAARMLMEELAKP